MKIRDNGWKRVWGGISASAIINSTLLLLLFGLGALAGYAERHEKIDPDLVASNRETLARCVDAKLCVDGFIRLRGSRGIMRIVPDDEDVFGNCVKVARLSELLAKNDEDADRFFNRIDSVILKNDKARWKDAYFAYWMDQSLPDY